MDTSTNETPHSVLAARTFGTNLSPNLTPRSPSTKKIKFRKSPRATPPYDLATYEYTVTFLPGPVGVQLEPVAKLSTRNHHHNGNNSSDDGSSVGCRVLKLVDGTRPGQARASGKICPGDLIVTVNGQDVSSAKYNNILDLLKQTDSVRQVGFRSVWDPKKLFSQNDNNNKTTGTNLGRLSTANSSNLSTNELTSDETWMRSDQAIISTSETPEKGTENKKNKEDNEEPERATTTDTSYKSPTENLPMFDIGLIHSPSETVLLSHVLSGFHGLKVSMDSGSTGPVGNNNNNNNHSFGGGYEAMFKSFFLGSTPVVTDAIRSRDLILSPSQVKNMTSQRKKKSGDEKANFTAREHRANDSAVVAVTQGSFGKVTDTANEGHLIDSHSEALERTVQAKAELLQELSLTKLKLDQENHEKQSMQDMLVSLALDKAQLQQKLLDQTEAARNEKVAIEEKFQKAVVATNLQSRHFQQLQLDYRNLREHARRLELQNKELQNERNAVPVDLNFKLQVAELESDLQKAREDKDLSGASLRQAETELSVAKVSILEMKASNEALQDELDSKSSQLDAKTSALQDALTQLVSFQADIEMKSGTLVANEYEIETLKNQQARSESVVFAVEHKVVALQADKERIEAALGSAKETIDRLETELKLSNDREVELSNALQQRQTELQTMEARAAQVEAKLTDSCRRADELEGSVSALGKAKEQLQRDHVTTMKSKSDLESRVESLEIELENRDTMLAAYAIDMMSAGANIEHYQHELQQAVNKVEGLTSEIDSLQNCNRDLHSQVETVENHANATKQKFVEEIASLNEVLTAAREELECQRQSAECAASRFEGQLATSKADASKYRNDLLELQRKIALMPAVSYTKNLKEIELRADSEKKDLQAKLAVCMNEADALRQQAAEAGSEVHRLTQFCQDLELHVQTKQAELQDMRNAWELAHGKLEEDRSSLVLELDKVRLENSSLSRSFQAQQQAMEATRRSKAELNEEYFEKVKQATRELATIRHDRDTALRNLARARDEVKLKSENVKHLEAALNVERDGKLKLATSAEEEKESFQKRLSLMEMEHARDSKNYQREQQALKSALQAAEGQNESFQHLLGELKSKLAALQNEFEKSSQEKQCFKTDLDRANYTISELQSQLQVLEEEAEIGSSEDSFNEEMDGLSKSELRVKCSYLQEELLVAATQASESNAIARKRATRIHALECDLQALSNETTKLVDANVLLEKKMVEMRTLIASNESEASTNKTEARNLDALVHNLNKKLDNQDKKNAALLRKVQTLTIELRESKEGAKEKEAELDRTKLRLRETNDSMNAARGEVEIERVHLLREIEDARLKIVAMEKNASNLLESLEKTRHSNSEKDKWNEQLAQTNLSLEEKCALLQRAIEASEKENNQLNCDLREARDHNTCLNEELDKCSCQLKALEDERGENLERLGKAAADLQYHKKVIKDLERKSQELSRIAEDKMDRIAALEHTIKKLEADAAEHDSHRSSEFLELQTKFSVLEKERKHKDLEIESVRGELRQSTRKLADLGKQNETLVRRVEEFKLALQATKAQLSEVRQGNVHSTTICKDYEGRLEAKGSEIQRLEAQIQILNATISRLKSDKVLLQEAALQAESKVARAEEQLHSNDRSGSLINGFQFGSTSTFEFVSDSQGDQFQEFLDSLVTLLGDLLEELMSRSEELEQSCKSVVTSFSLRALDLASIKHRATPITEAQSCVDALASLVSKMVSQLREKQDDLIIRHGSRLDFSTASQERKVSHDHYVVLDAFRKMKQLVGGQMSASIVTPSRNLAHSHNNISEAMQFVESQLEGLLNDVTEAKDALKSKGRLISELERIIRQRDTECKSMEDRLRNKIDLMREMNEKLKEEVECRRESEEQVLRLRVSLGTQPVNPLEREILQKKKAAQFIHDFTEKRSRQAAANAFRHWACATSAMKAVSHQVHVAHALSHQLETTREKLVVLKSHLKHQKCRRLGGSQSSRSTSRARHALECLTEGDESFTL